MQSNVWLHLMSRCVRIVGRDREDNTMKKKDWLLIIIVLAVAGTGFGIHTMNGKKDAGFVTVTVDGKVQGVYSLDEEQTIDINHTNTLVIKDGKADMTAADCPDKLCVHQKAISRRNESIICLPNKVIVEVTSGEEGELNAVAN